MTAEEETMRALTGGAARKKAKTIDHDEELAATAFGLYRRHLDALDDNEDDDEHLRALMQLMEKSSSSIRPFQEPLSSIATPADMLGILSSVVYHQMASAAIERYLEGKETCPKPSQDYIDKALAYFPRNAACRSVAANFGRITETLPQETITQWYHQAAQHAHQVWQETLALLEREYENDSVKEWMELLLLHQVVGVEYLVDDDDDQEQQQDEQGIFSPSSVEGTARFMAAMLLSRDGHHEDALQHLKSFALTHRLHPNVWTGQGSCPTTTTTRATKTAVPVSLRGVLPPRLYERMLEVFAPDASFWRESDYAHQGYYSFLADIDSKEPPKNLIDDVVLNHLLPLAKQVLGNSRDICAYEWWAHSRHASLGHTLHFDTDEATLEADDTVHHPLLSSVLHLTGDESSGATIVLDQTLDSSDSAQVCWRSVPHPNTFMVFPGNLLHGVLPCSGTATATRALSNKDAHSTEGPWIQAPSPTSHHRRLTFMVGFKTRRVPDQRQGEGLYGPCAPLPPATEEWVKEIQRGYNEDSPFSREPRQESIVMQELPHVSPAWERIVSNEEEAPLPLPSALDQRFFVKGAPECFRSSLLEND